MKMRSRAKRPRNTDRELSPEEVRKGFEKQFPDVDMSALLADPTNKESTRHFNALLTKRLLVEATARAFCSREGEPVPYWLNQIPSLIRLDATIVGNLGEREIRLPSDPALALCQMLGITLGQGKQLAAALPQLGPRKEKVIDAGPRSAG